MSQKSPWLYHFTVSRPIEQEIEIDPITNDEGEEIKQFKKIKELIFKDIQPHLKEKFGYKNILMVPKIEKIILNLSTSAR